MPMTYMELAHHLANQGYTQEEFADVLKELTGEDYYAADPNTYIEGDFGVTMQEGGDDVSYQPRPDPRLVEPAPPAPPAPPAQFDMPFMLQVQEEEERLKREAREEEEFFASSPSPTGWMDAPDLMTEEDIAKYPTHVQPHLREKYGLEGTAVPADAAARARPMRVGGRLDVGMVPAPPVVPEPPAVPMRAMSTQELAGASGRPQETLRYPEEYEHMLATIEALEQDPESVYREETAPEPEPEPDPMPSAMAMSGRFPHPATFEGPAKPSLERPLPSALADYMEGKRLIAGELRDEPEATPSAVAEHMEGKRLAAGRLEDIPSADYRGEDYVTRLDPDPIGDAPLLAAVAEKKRKGELREEFYEKAERPPVGPRDLAKAAMDPFDFAGTVMDNDSISVWSSAMWERFIQLFEVPVEKAIEGDLRLQRLIRQEEWDSDEDFQLAGLSQFVTGKRTGKGNVLTGPDKRNLERLWDHQDADVVEGLIENMTSTEAKAALYPFLTNARKSVGNLANGLWDMGVSMVGGNIPDAVWREKSPEERARMLEEQAHGAIDEMFGKGMATFVITVLANPAAAVEVYPAEISFMAYRPMKAMARPAGRKFVQAMDGLLEWQGAKGPVRAAMATAIKRGAAATKRALADPAAHYTKGGEEFLEQSGREAVLAEEAIKEGFDVVGRAVSEDIAAGKGPKVIDTRAVAKDIPLTDRQKYLQEIVFDTPEEAARLSVMKPDKAALEAGVLDSVEGLSATQWPHTPRRQLGYEFDVQAVTISAKTGEALGKPRKIETAKRDPKPTILPEEAMDMIRDLNEIYGPDGAILRGLVTEEGLAQQVIAAVDINLANQFSSPKGRSTVVEAVVEQVNAEAWGGKMPRKVKSAMKKTVMEAMEDAAGRRRGEGGTSSVYNPVFELDGPGGKTIRVNALQALAKKQKSDPAFRKAIQEETLEYVSERIGAQAKARGVQDGVLNAIVRDSDVVGKTEYAMASAADRVAMRAEALKGSNGTQKKPGVQQHTKLKRKLEKEKAKPDKEQDAAAIEKMTERLDDMEGTAAKPGVVDKYLDGLIDTYRRTGDRPSTWLFGDTLEHAWARLAEKSPKSVEGLWMLREHLKPRNAQKVFGSGLTGDQALMSTYFGFTKPSEGAQAAFRRASAKPFTDITTIMPDRYMSLPLYKVSELMARDAGVLPAMFSLKWMEKAWRNIKLGKVAGNPGSHFMALGSNTLLQMQRRGDMFVAVKAAGTLVDYMRFKAGMKTLVDPQVYRSLEHSGRVSGAMIKGEIDANLRRMLDNPEFATKDWAGDFMTAGIGRRVYDWWDTMFKLEDGVNQWGRRMKEWESLPAGTGKNPIEYHFPISRTKTIKAQKINGKMVVDGRVLTDAQFRHMMGRAAMEPGSRFLVDFKDVPLLAIFKRNFPLLDMMMSDFSTWRMVTDTFPFLKEGIFGEIMLGATPRGWTSHAPLRMKRSAEMAIANTARTMMAGTLSQRVSGEDHQMLRSMLNRYGGPSPVYAFSATADTRVMSVADGTSFSVYESVERWIRTAEAMAYTAPSKGTFGETIQEWVGYLKPEATIEIPGLKGEDPTTQMAFFMSPSQLAKLTPAQRRHVEQSMAYWKDNAATGGMGRKAAMGLAYLEGNLYLNMVMNVFFETRREAEMGWNLSTADLIINTFAPRWGSGLVLYGLEEKREGDIAKYRDAVAAMAKEEKRIKAIPEAERSKKDKRRLQRFKDPQRMLDLEKKHLGFAKGVSAITRHEYRPEAILGALDPSMAETPLTRLAQRWFHQPRAVAIFHQYNVDLETKKRTKKPRKRGMEAVGFTFKGTAIEGYIDRSVRQFMRGLSDAMAIHREATYAAEGLDAEAMKAHRKIYKPGEKLKEIEKVFREKLTEQAQGMQKRWQDMFGELALKAEQKGPGRAPRSLRRAKGPHKIPKTGWTEEPEPTMPGKQLFTPP